MKCFLLLIVFMVVVMPISAQNKFDQNLSKSNAQSINTKIITYNNWLMYLRSNGSWSYDPGDSDANGTNSGGEFPRGSGVFVNYAGGMIIGAKRNGTPITSEVLFTSEFVPGSITSSKPLPIGQLTRSDLSSDKLYLIDQSRSGSNYFQWPKDFGAPISPTDNPLVVSDADTWCVFNDADTSLSQQTNAPAGLGMEIQRRTYAYGVAGLSNTIFIRFIITNKSSHSYDSVYVGFCGDPDLDNGSNDLIGTDLGRKMCYVYNATSIDAAAAVGYKLLYSSGHGNNVQINSVTSYSNGTDPHTSLEFFNLLQGLTLVGNSRVNGPFDFTGDPVNGTGILDPSGGDKRMMLTTGPLSFAPGQTHQLIYAVVAKTGADRIAAIINLRSEVDALASAGASTVFRDPISHTQNATNITSISAKIHGMVLPNRLSTIISVEYGETVSYGLSKVITTSSDSNSVAVSTTLTDLQPNTIYHYRIVSSNATGKTFGLDQSFTTGAAEPPGILKTFVSEVTSNSARLNAIVDPGNIETIVYFESGETTQYGRADTALTLDGSAIDTVSVVLNGLNENQSYHYRVLAINVIDTIESADSTFSTIAKPLNLWMTVHQNPVLTHYADIFVISDTMLHAAPIVKSVLNNDTTIIPMTIIPSTQSYKGSVVFTSNGFYTFIASGISVNNSSTSISKTYSVTLAKRGQISTVALQDGSMRLIIPADALQQERYVMASKIIQNGESIYDVSSFEAEREMEIILQYRPEQFQNESNLFIYWQNGEDWMPVQSQVYPRENQIKTHVKKLGKFKIMNNPHYSGSNIVPNNYTLKANYPNPFNPTTTIAYDLPSDGRITITIYNPLGQVVKQLVDGFHHGGSYTVQWNGLNDAGQQVASGVYFYRLQAGQVVKTNKMLLLK